MDQGNIRIDKYGDWFYGSTPIVRAGLIKLFYSALQRRGDEYYIVTPVEEVRIDVEDAPFAVVAFWEIGADIYQAELNEGSKIPINGNHPVRMDANGMIYIRVRDNLEARFNRRSYRELAQYVQSDDRGRLYLRSAAVDFYLDEPA